MLLKDAQGAFAPDVLTQRVCLEVRGVKMQDPHIQPPRDRMQWIEEGFCAHAARFKPLRNSSQRSEPCTVQPISCHSGKHGTTYRVCEWTTGLVKSESLCFESQTLGNIFFCKHRKVDRSFHERANATVRFPAQLFIHLLFIYCGLSDDSWIPVGSAGFYSYLSFINW